MDGYVIGLQQDSDDTVTGYWTGSAITSNIEDSAFITDLTTARQTSGALQAQYTDREVKILAATKGITLKNVVQGF